MTDSMRLRAMAIAAMTLMIPLPAVSAAETAAPARASVGQITFEPRDHGVAVIVRTGNPVPRFLLSMGLEESPEVTLEFPEAAFGATPGEPSSSPFVESVKVAAGQGQKSAIVRLRPRQARLVGVELRQDGVAMLLAAVSAVDQKEDEEYRVGIGDKIEIGVFGHEDLSKLVEVRTDGTINIPLLGDVRVVGKTVAQIDADLTAGLGKEYLVDPEVSVDVREFKSQWVTLMGEVRTPGRYMLRRNMRLIDLLAEAGGATKDAGAEIVLTRHQDQGSGTRQTVIPMDDILNPRKADANVLLRHGDVVTVTERQAFYIRGEIARPGPYYIERGMTVLKAISVAGGLTQFANRKEVQLLRSREGAIQEKTVVNLKAIEDGHKEDIPILPNDILIVPRRIF